MFEFVVDVARIPVNDEKTWEIELARLSQIAAGRTEEERSAQQEVEEEVFKQIFIPRSLLEVDFPERDIAGIKSGNKEEAYQTVTGVKIDAGDCDIKSSEDCRKPIRKGSLSSGSANTEEESCTSDDDLEAQTKFKDGHRPRTESPNSRKERKKLVREEKAEKRETKMKKHVKKRKEKAGRSKIKK